MKLPIFILTSQEERGIKFATLLSLNSISGFNNVANV